MGDIKRSKFVYTHGEKPGINSGWSFRDYALIFLVFDFPVKDHLDIMTELDLIKYALIIYSY